METEKNIKGITPKLITLCYIGPMTFYRRRFNRFDTDPHNVVVFDGSNTYQIEFDLTVDADKVSSLLITGYPQIRILGDPAVNKMFKKHLRGEYSVEQKYQPGNIQRIGKKEKLEPKRPDISEPVRMAESAILSAKNRFKGTELPESFEITKKKLDELKTLVDTKDMEQPDPETDAAAKDVTDAAALLLSETTALIKQQSLVHLKDGKMELVNPPDTKELEPKVEEPIAKDPAKKKPAKKPKPTK